MRASGVLRLRPAESLTSAAPAIMVGRDHELQTLSAAVAAPPSVVTVVGEAGIGKTRLVREMQAPSATTVLYGSCSELGGPFPLEPVIGALRSEASRLKGRTLAAPAGCLRELLPELSNVLPAPLPAIQDAAARRHRLYRGIEVVLRALAPAVLVLEDLHNADDLTLELLGAFAPTIPSDLSLVLTTRPGSAADTLQLVLAERRLAPAARRVEIDLEPLAPDDAAEFLRHLLGHPPEPELAERVWQATAGIPFVVEEVARGLLDDDSSPALGSRSDDDLRNRLQVPRTVRASVLQPLGELTAGAREVVEAAAVFDSGLTEVEVACLVDLDVEVATDHLQEALAANTLSERTDGTVGFRHDLARRAVYESLPASRRRTVHQRAARMLGARTPGELSRIAHHYRHADDIDNWIRYGEQTAEEALEVNHHAIAARILHPIVTSARIPEETKNRLVPTFAAAACQGLRPDTAMPLLAGLAEDPDLGERARAEARIFLANLQCLCGQWDEGRDGLRQGLPHLDDHLPSTLEAMSLLAIPLLLDDEPLEDHVRHLDKVAAGVDTLTPSPIKTRLLGNVAYIRSYVGDAAADASLDEIPWDSTDHGQQTELARCAYNLSLVLAYRGETQPARELLGRGQRACRESGYARFEEPLRRVGYLLDWLTCQWSGLAAVVAEELETDSPWRCELELIDGALSLAVGDIHPATRKLKEAARSAVAHEEAFMLAAVAGQQCRLARSRDTHNGVPDAAMELLEIVRTKGTWVWMADALTPLVQLHIKRGEEDVAATIADEFDRGTRQRHTPVSNAALVSSRATLRRDPDAWAAAVKAWERSGRAYQALHAQEELGSLLLDAGDHRGEQILTAVEERYWELDASWDRDRVRQRLRVRGAPVPNHRGRRGYGDKLSPREREVAILAARGMTNPEIADQLFLSKWTIADHVSAALRKLGIESRTQFDEEALRA